MSLSSARNSVARTQKDIADIRSKDAQESKKEADLNGKIASATSQARSTSSTSTMISKLKDVERYSKDLANVQKRRADFAKQMANKTGELNRNLSSMEREEESDRKRFAAEEKRLNNLRTKQLRELDTKINQRKLVVASLPPSDTDDERFDVFISHASEDKEAFVRPFAEKLTLSGLAVWYDELTLSWGDGLRRSIDKGLSKSRFGVVVLSENFFRKQWTQLELDGLVQMEMAGQSHILPIWHKVTKDEVAQFSPTLADKLALNTGVMTVDEIVSELVKLCGMSQRDHRK